MTLNTLKTIFGFLETLVTKYTPLKLSKETLEGIYNYHPINKTLATSGQPSEQQFSLIRDAGYNFIINLAPHNAENSINNEAALLAQLGLQYIHIPVDFKNPTHKDFDKFVATMNQTIPEKTWVHCAANMRVSAFIFKYRRDVIKDDLEQATADLVAIWKPYGAWKRFIR
jgi:protein tyrosine phosphatase (PTP) superfamily phosphohydrolase (DUF442 family)